MLLHDSLCYSMQIVATRPLIVYTFNYELKHITVQWFIRPDVQCSILELLPLQLRSGFICFDQTSSLKSLLVEQFYFLRGGGDSFSACEFVRESNVCGQLGPDVNLFPCINFLQHCLQTANENGNHRDCLFKIRHIIISHYFMIFPP